jgi:2-amino-4-hydroxy-6-hydroxymethyldihydropteridine diphosphokinase
MGAPARVFVGLGGNLGGEAALVGRFARVIAALAAEPGIEVLGQSSPWRTAPQGPVLAQPTFVNAVVELGVRARAPLEVLALLLEIESRFGRDRRRETPQGPRVLDLDLLLWDQAELDETGPPRLIVPHPRLGARAFALAPLVELAGPDLVVPGPRGGRAGTLLARLMGDPTQPIEKM